MTILDEKRRKLAEVAQPSTNRVASDIFKFGLLTIRQSDGKLRTFSTSCSGTVVARGTDIRVARPRLHRAESGKRIDELCDP
jgi:hypothetical protein